MWFAKWALTGVIIGLTLARRSTETSDTRRTVGGTRGAQMTEQQHQHTAGPLYDTFRSRGTIVTRYRCEDPDCPRILTEVDHEEWKPGKHRRPKGTSEPD